MSNIKKTAVFMADGLEECEALVVVDLLRRADIMVDMISVSGSKHISGSHNIGISADLLFEEADLLKYDALFLPGGLNGSRALAAHKELSDCLVNSHKDKKLIAAICAAPYILARLNILNGKQATCYPSFKNELTDNGACYLNEKVVVDGNIVTSSGLGCVFLFSAKLIELLISKEAANSVLESICH